MRFVIPLTNLRLYDNRSLNRFSLFIRVSLINRLRYIIINNKQRFNTLLTPFSITADELLNSLSRLIICTPYSFGIVVGISNSVYVKNIRISTVIKAIDFGSTVTGKGNRVFVGALQEVKENISSYYQEFIGLRVR